MEEVVMRFYSIGFLAVVLCLSVFTSSGYGLTPSVYAEVGHINWFFGSVADLVSLAHDLFVGLFRSDTGGGPGPCGHYCSCGGNYNVSPVSLRRVM